MKRRSSKTTWTASLGNCKASHRRASSQKMELSVNTTLSVSFCPSLAVNKLIVFSVCATGFDVSFSARFPFVGRDGQQLDEEFGRDPKSYMFALALFRKHVLM